MVRELHPRLSVVGNAITYHSMYELVSYITYHSKSDLVSNYYNCLRERIIAITITLLCIEYSTTKAVSNCCDKAKVVTNLEQPYSQAFLRMLVFYWCYLVVVGRWLTILKKGTASQGLNLSVRMAELCHVLRQLKGVGFSAYSCVNKGALMIETRQLGINSESKQGNAI